MDAFRRLAETAAGLHSQAFGENRIVAQIKEALIDAQEKGFAGSFLQGWTDTALHISKEIRHATRPNLPALETEDLVFQTLGKNCPNNGKVLIVGRGEIGQGLARRFPDAVQISGRSDDELRQWLPKADVVICATGSAGFIIDESHRSLLRDSAVLIDLSLPRNINPELPGVIGLSALRAAVQPENAEELFAKAREITDAHHDEYERLVKFQ
jgi:glutamyl-tRNA reductase